MASTAFAAAASSTTASSFTFGTKFTCNSPPVDFRLALLSAKALDFGDRQTLDAGADEGLTHLVELGRV